MFGAREQSQSLSLDCPLCNRSFGRQEHLTRHMRIHTREKPYPCASCQKSFSRLDVLNRHIASHEEHNHVTIPTATSRACMQCASDRVRCSRDQPCRRCAHRGISCQYPAPRRARGRLLQHSTDTHVGEGATNHTASFTTNVLETSENDGGFIIPTLSGTLGESSVGAWPWIGSIGLERSMDSSDLPAMALSDINWLSSRYLDIVNIDAPANFGVNIHGSGAQVVSSVTVASSSNHVVIAHQPQSHLANINVDTYQASSVTSSGNSRTMSENRYYVDGSGARAPFGGRCQDSNCSIESNGMLQDAEANEATPPSEVSITSPLCPLAAYDSLMQGIANECHNCQIDMDATDLPTHEQVHLYVRHYFNKFHPIFPFLRQSTFINDVSNSWLLLLAVSVVGSRFTRRSQNPRPGEALFRLLRLILKRYRYGFQEQENTAENKHTEYMPGQQFQKQTLPSLHILQAGILNIACMLHSGKQALVAHAFVERHFLVEACNSLELLVHTTGINHTEFSAQSDSDGVIHEWLARQSKIRTGMMIWALDTMFVYEFQAKPLMQIDDVKAALPSHEDVWEQLGLIHPARRVPPDITLMDALEMIYVEKKLPPNLGEFSVGLLITAIYRNTKDILAREQVRLNSWTPTALTQRRSEKSAIQQDWLPTTQSAIKWRNSACDCLDVLHWPANSKAARCSGSEHHTILHLHLARLIILTPTVFIQTFAKGPRSKDDSSSDMDDSQAFRTARLQVLQWAIQDQCKARLSLIHCGALFWHVRRYSCDSMLEPYAIYIATLILWAFCVCMQLPEVAEAIVYEFDDDPEPSFFHLDRPLDDELVQTYVRVGHKMSAFITNVGSIQDRTARRKIVKEGISLLAKHSSSPSPDNQNPSPLSAHSKYTWGIEQSYISLLSVLAEQEEHRCNAN